MKYRPEIDGLRAVAVLPVVLYHAGSDWVSGGFIGVDVFFVISGYLITSIILNELQQERFSFLRFYERRARRILPALFVLLICIVPPAWLLFPPEQLERLAKSMLASILFISNIHFWGELNYFSRAAEDYTLIHTWSLAIEEQFYLLFPLALLLFWRWKWSLRYWVMALTAASFAICLYGIYHSPAATFFLLPTRLWELSAGSLCAIWLGSQGVMRRPALAMLGLAMLLAGIIWLNKHTPFPSHYALLPVIGTVLIILFAAPGTWVYRLLSFSPLVWLGLISYSTYLWHQPLFVFARHLSLSPLDGIDYTGLVLLTLAVAALSWRWVEQPFRQRSAGGAIALKPFCYLSGAAALLLVAGCLWIWQQQGFPNRSTPSGIRFAQLKLAERFQLNHGLCRIEERQFRIHEECVYGSNPEVMLWGDSFAQHLAVGLKEVLPETSGFYQFVLPACAPFLQAATTGMLYDAPSCLRFNQDLMKWLQQQPQIHTVILSASFVQWASAQDRFLNAQGETLKGSLELIRVHLQATLEQLRRMGKRVVLVTPTPHSYNDTTLHDIGSCLREAEIWGKDPARCGFTFQPELADLLNQFANMATIVPLHTLFCDAGHCLPLYDAAPAYIDYGHLRIETSRRLVPDALQRAGVSLTEPPVSGEAEGAAR